MHAKSMNAAVLVLHVFHVNCKLMVSINCSRNLSPTEGITAAAQRVHIESEYWLSQYKFTRKCALRCTARNRRFRGLFIGNIILSNKDTQKSWRMCLTLAETKIRHVQHKIMAYVSHPSGNQNSTRELKRFFPISSLLQDFIGLETMGIL